MEDEQINWRSYFSNLPEKEIKRAKGLVYSDETKRNTKTFKQLLDEQNERNERIYKGMKDEPYNASKFLSYVLGLIIGILFFYNFIFKK